MQLWALLVVHELPAALQSLYRVQSCSLLCLTSSSSVPQVSEILCTCTAGEYLKTKRSLIRANEKLAGLSERVEQLKQALHKAGLNNGTESPSARSDTSTQPFGTPKSVQAGTPKAHM